MKLKHIIIGAMLAASFTAATAETFMVANVAGTAVVLTDVPCQNGSGESKESSEAFVLNEVGECVLVGCWTMQVGLAGAEVSLKWVGYPKVATLQVSRFGYVPKGRP